MSNTVRGRVGLRISVVLVVVVFSVLQQTARADLLSRVELPKTSEEAPLDLGTLPAADAAKCTISVFGHHPQGNMYGSQRPPYRCDKTGDAWRVFSDRSPSTPIATLKFNGEHLMFSWEHGVTKQVAAGLRNCLLQVTISATNADPNNFNQNSNVKTVALRTPTQAPGNVVGLKQTADIYNPEVEDLPEGDTLLLEVVGLSGYEGALKFNPENKRASLKQPVHVILKPATGTSPGLRLDVTLTKLGSSLALEARPIVFAGDNAGTGMGMGSGTYSLTMRALTDAQTKIRTQLTNHTVKLKNDEKLLTALETRLAQLNTATNRTVKQKAAFDQQVSHLQGQLTTDRQKIDQLRRQVAVYQAGLDAVPELIRIANDIDGKAAVEFRILYPLDKQTVVLFATEKAPTDAPPPQQF